MRPMRNETLWLGEIAEHWAQDPSHRLTEGQIRTRLLQDYWASELEFCEGNGMLPRATALEILRDTPNHRTIVVHADVGSVPPDIINFPDGSCDVDLRHHVVIPADAKLWSDELVERACEVLSQCKAGAYARSFVTGFFTQNLSREQFGRYCDQAGYARPAFWFARISRKASTRRAEMDCKRLLRRLVREFPSKTKAWYWSQAQSEVPRISRRGFEKGWANVAPEDAKKPGRRAKLTAAIKPPIR